MLNSIDESLRRRSLQDVRCFLLCLLIEAFLGWNCSAATNTVAVGQLEYFVIVTGGELLEGVYPDAHTPFVTRTLRPLGCRCAGSMVVDDVRTELLQALQFATNHAPLVIVTGGLGPTPNDITREVVSEFTGIKLREHPAVLASMQKRFQHPDQPLRANLRRQCLVPEPGGYLENRNGTAVGLVFDLGARAIIALPGPPRELQGMVRQELMEWLRSRFGVRAPGASLTLRFVGAGQSLIDATIKEHANLDPDVTITSLFEGSRVDFTFSVPGNTAADHARLKSIQKALMPHLGKYFYSDEGLTLEGVAIRKLHGAGPLAIVELSSGGQLGAALARAGGADTLLTAAFSFPSFEAAARTLKIPPETPDNPEGRVKALARAAAKIAGVRRSIAVGPREAGPGGAAVWLVLHDEDRHGWARKLAAPPAGEIGGAGMITSILDLLLDD